MDRILKPNSEKIELGKHIKDIEAELDFMYMREPDDVMYICKLEKQINKLYEKLDTLTDESKATQDIDNVKNGE